MAIGLFLNDNTALDKNLGPDYQKTHITEKVVDFYNRNAYLLTKHFTQHTDHLDEFAELLQKGSILDIGCGTGINANYMASLGFSVIGIDSSREMIRIAKESFGGVQFRIGDMTKIDFRDTLCNGIIASYSLIHIPKLQIPFVLSLFHSLLRNDGMIYIAVQSGESKEGFFPHPLIEGDVVFLNIYSKEEILSLLDRYHFRVLKQYCRPYKLYEHKYTKLFLIAKKESA
jgi:2-polyprenyl-3-methyl-5-hydroxy-6-metoxy-1,4-benzoquinol methylase